MSGDGWEFLVEESVNHELPIMASRSSVPDEHYFEIIPPGPILF